MLVAARCLLLALLLLAPACPAASAASEYDRDAALRRSQAVIGKRLDDHAFTASDGRPVRFADLRGTPFLVSLVYTSCYHSCPVTTQRLADAVAEARAVLGADSFRVVTIGFDAAHDTPDRMRVFGREQKVGGPGWHLLSADPSVIDRVIAELGFTRFPSARGFDHIAQVTVVDRDGVIYRQVYGEMFELPALVEPLKELVFNKPRPGTPVTASIADRIRLFCTVYDPASGRYRFDYSLFVEILVGLLVILSVSAYLVVEARRGRDR